MRFICCICEATTGEIRAGRIREGFGVPTCNECHAKIYWRSRQPQPQQITALPISHQLAFERVMMQSAAGARGDAPEAA